MPEITEDIIKCSDPEELSPSDREMYLSYWALRAPAERLSEMWRISAIKYGVDPDARMDKSHFEIIDISKYAKK